MAVRQVRSDEDMKAAEEAAEQSEDTRTPYGAGPQTSSGHEDLVARSDQGGMRQVRGLKEMVSRAALWPRPLEISLSLSLALARARFDACVRAHKCHPQIDEYECLGDLGDALVRACHEE